MSQGYGRFKSPPLQIIKISMVDAGLLTAGHKAGMVSGLSMYLLFNKT